MPIIHGARALLAAAGRALSAAAEPTAAPASTVDPFHGVGEALRRLLAPQRASPVQPDFEARRLAGIEVEPQVRAYIRWTPADLRTAALLADGGNLRMAADLCEAMLGDDRIPAVFATRVNAVLGSELAFEAGFGRKKARAVKALEVGEDWYLAFPEAVIGYLLVWGRLLGVSPAQECWREFADHDGRIIPAAENWHARHLRWDQRERAWYIRVGDTGREVKAAPGDGKWIIFTPYGTNRPWSMGMWRGMSRLWLLKQYAIDDWGQTGKKAAEGLKVATPPPGPGGSDAKHGKPNLRKELANDIAELSEGGVIVLPPGFDLKMVEQVANTWEMFKAQIDMANAGISIMAIGTNLPTEVANAAQTGATAQTLVRLDYKKADAEALSTMAHDQSLTNWAEFNFGDRGLAPWPDWMVEPAVDLKAGADILLTFAEAVDKLTASTVPVDVPELAKRFDVPLRAGEDNQLQSPRVYEYHLKYGVMTTNEIRQTLGLPPVAAGNEVPLPIAPVPGSRPEPEASRVTRSTAIDAALERTAMLHNQGVTADTLRLVWDRGAALAPPHERDRWGISRVNAFLRLLAEERPAHPGYTADNDLLPPGHRARGQA